MLPRVQVSFFLIYLFIPGYIQTTSKDREKIVTVVSTHSDEGPSTGNYQSFDLPASAKRLSPISLYEVGESLLMQGKPEESAPFLAHAAEQLTNDPFAQGNFAIALHQV
jgi:hypothetical protein